MPDFPQTAGISEHGSSKHDATVSKKRVSFIPIGVGDMMSQYEGTSYATTEHDVPIDMSKFDKVEAVYFACFVTQENSGTFMVYAELYNETDNTSITGSEVSADLSQWTRQQLKSGDIKANMPSTEKWLTARYKVESGGKIRLYTAVLIIVQSE